MTHKKIEERFPELKEKINLYRMCKKNANRSKYVFKISNNENDKQICLEYLNAENKWLKEIKQDILTIIREQKIFNRNQFQYWLERVERTETL